MVRHLQVVVDHGALGGSRGRVHDLVPVAHVQFAAGDQFVVGHGSPPRARRWACFPSSAGLEEAATGCVLAPGRSEERRVGKERVTRGALEERYGDILETPCDDSLKQSYTAPYKHCSAVS